MVYTIFIFISLVYIRNEVKIKKSTFLMSFLVFFHILFALNYSRNMDFYRSIGINNFYSAGISEIITYVGSPFQGFLISGAYGDRLDGISELESHQFTGISVELSTNSAYLELVRQYGVLKSFLLIDIIVFIGGFLMSFAIKNKNNILVLIFGVIGYCFAEIWRLFLFSQGIVLTILIIIFLIAGIKLILPKLKIYRTIRSR